MRRAKSQAQPARKFVKLSGRFLALLKASLVAMNVSYVSMCGGNAHMTKGADL